MDDDIEYSWDEPKKRLRNLKKHGVDFNIVRCFEWDTAIVESDSRYDYGEYRYLARGYIGNHLYTMAFTPRNESIHVISLRQSNRREVKNYETR